MYWIKITKTIDHYFKGASNPVLKWVAEATIKSCDIIYISRLYR